MTLPAVVVYTILSLLPQIVRGQSPALTGCGESCYLDLVAKHSSLGCFTPDQACLCASQDFHYGMNDCTKSLCASTQEDPQVPLDLVKSFCASVVANAASASTSSPAASVDTSTTSSPGASIDASPTAPVLPPIPATPSASIILSSNPAATPTKTFTPTATPAHEVASYSPLSDNMSATTATSETTSAPSQSAIPSSPAGLAPPGLTTTAKIGIAVGAAAGLLLVLLVGFVIIRSRRARQPTGASISPPLPGSGRTYPDTLTEKAYTELEMKSRKYEDMLPRQKPRHMV